MGWIFSTSPPALLKKQTRSSLMASLVNHDGKLDSVSRFPQFTVPIPSRHNPRPQMKWPFHLRTPATGPAFDSDSELSELADDDQDGTTSADRREPPASSLTASSSKAASSTSVLAVEVVPSLPPCGDGPKQNPPVAHPCCGGGRGNGGSSTSHGRRGGWAR